MSRLDGGEILGLALATVNYVGVKPSGLATFAWLGSTEKDVEARGPQNP